jgi:3-oxoacyl-[acyl-carrier-protein] synthase II
MEKAEGECSGNEPELDSIEAVLYPLKSIEGCPRRVVMTGAGIVSALGVGWDVNAEGFRSGRNGFRPVTLFDVSRQRTQQAAEVRELGEPTWLRGDDRKRWRRWDRSAHMLAWAAHEAWSISGWLDNEPTSNPVDWVIATTSGGMSLGEEFYSQTTQSHVTSRGQATRTMAYPAGQQVLDVARLFGEPRSRRVVANACASGSNAIGLGWEMLRWGQSNRVLAGGYDALSHLVFAGFDALQALSTTVCRPFDRDRDGLGLGEGAAMVAMESLDGALNRGATILGEIVGYGAATDLHHLTQPHPDGDAAVATMRKACAVAGVEPSAVDYVNAHGTGTRLNDAAESMALERWAGDCIGKILVSSVKGSIGHCLGAAGALETVVCLMALRGGWIPPTCPLENTDPACRFPVIATPTNRRLHHALSNSFGFGGANATLLFRRWE